MKTAKTIATIATIATITVTKIANMFKLMLTAMCTIKAIKPSFASIWFRSARPTRTAKIARSFATLFSIGKPKILY